MKIAIIGYGKMGRVIEEIAISRGHKIVAKITSSQPHFSAADLNNAEVAIEFSVPQAAVENIQTCFEGNIPVVVGTTGWLDQLPEVTALCKKLDSALFYASNFSVGVNIFFEINKHLARLMNSQLDYDVRMEEIHHTQKLDSPSGTALSLAQQILAEVERKENWKETLTPTPSELGIHAKRIADTPGTHTICYESDIDKIEITHEAKGRKGFALGAVLAAEFLANKKGVYGMSDLLQF